MAEPHPAFSQFFVLDHPALTRTVCGRIERLRGEFAAQLTNGYVVDWPDYKEKIGVIRGLSLALQACAESEDELNK